MDKCAENFRATGDYRKSLNTIIPFILLYLFVYFFLCVFVCVRVRRVLAS